MDRYEFVKKNRPCGKLRIEWFEWVDFPPKNLNLRYPDCDELYLAKFKTWQVVCRDGSENPWPRGYSLYHCERKPGLNGPSRGTIVYKTFVQITEDGTLTIEDQDLEVEEE